MFDLFSLWKDSPMTQQCVNCGEVADETHEYGPPDGDGFRVAICDSEKVQAWHDNPVGRPDLAEFFANQEA